MVSLSTYLRLLVAFQAMSAITSKIVYTGYKVYRLTPSTDEHVRTLQELQSLGVDFWTGPSQIGIPSDAMFAPHQQGDFLNSALEMENQLYVPDVDTLIQKETVGKARANGLIDWKNYYRLDDIYAYLDKMAADSSYAEVVTYGQSYECRDLKLMKISKPGGRSKKPAVFIESNTHAREWIANAVATYLINELLTGALKNRVDEFDFYIVPVANPDGYEFSHTDDRMWRKTRRVNENSVCVGVDPNRNWDYKWMTGGSSNDPCSDSYAGSQAFTESEVVSMVDYYKTVVDQVRLFIAIHSYSQLLLFPWGYTKDRIPDYDRYKEVSVKAAEALKKVHGSKYNYGSVPEFFGEKSGSVLDWMYGMHPEVPLSLAVELRDTGHYGFVLPPEQIIPTAEEFIAAFNVYLDNVKS